MTTKYGDENATPTNEDENFANFSIFGFKKIELIREENNFEFDYFKRTITVENERALEIIKLKF